MEEWQQFIDESLDLKSKKRLKTVLLMKNNTCHLKPEPKRFYRVDLECQTWSESSKYTTPEMTHCGSPSLSPTPCQFLYSYIADHLISLDFNNKASLKFLVQSFTNWQKNDVNKFGCHVAQEMTNLTEEFRDVLCFEDWRKSKYHSDGICRFIRSNWCIVHR